ncbi:pantoate--beta-alanine ligase [Shewanella oneidensis MR-1]|uniref:Pantothenate synthetase n=1 Tax=Shewanella oneidensis (strain ATCC 700550 / JCM 31522 / CIP 106686 / LMG 19005 / NCIMB 14063 / MR-1) TaxID=211586 RepID=PANC_SHEON|nr:pantoate--beta-alanine ligase [Shewanella oneidensis]Q8EIH0.1 RecName: Full=Pantothenate synthetase; Short=PS; AltName: Full=Pantoate--beta-alanine ligase; AltName: Full=Pantoate-activating enzyme [Shewanella oneidensis MR-1]AAN53945.1 pantoate--beta-alanine ligase PanC [Shewanella oneidensis MR-1]MDX5997232.1 pantoate--beta-alanine ligase [Shewanella oneidensis]MEE2027359.1 Pantothenate synthetase [Shewanella oneidensis]QKG95723.1 pantoate--beta-alanine ligase [Shewanella oneidensis MR-1]
MITSAHIDDIRTQVRAWRAKGETVAFVPTMGNLHQGHITLVKEAAKKCDHVVASIFVNPMQFGQNEDLDAYPRTLEADSQALTAAGAELLFTPTPAIIYPKGLAQQTYVEVPGISDVLCGASRPGHFRGVATIVCKLFNIVQPDIAFFGNKDYQQLLVIRTMVEDLSLPIEIIGIDTIREASGLAMSSRNGYLTAQEKAAAPALKKAIDAMAQGIKQGISIEQVTEEAKASLTAAGFTPDYLEVRHADTLAKAETQDKALVILAAAYLGKARLIDNLRFDR